MKFSYKELETLFYEAQSGELKLIHSFLSYSARNLNYWFAFVT